MPSRKQRAQIAKQTVEIMQQGYYVTATEQTVHLLQDLQRAKERTRLYVPDDFFEVSTERKKLLRDANPNRELSIEVVNATTFATARRLVEEEGRTDVCCLNFASAKNPGGGFLGGSQAQEECLARASGMYACIAPKQTMYQTNREHRSCLYTDHVIYSPDVPVFRNDDDVLLEKPYLVSIITAPAVNAGAVSPGERHLIKPTMIERMEKVLSLAVIHQNSTLILGAWGCGVFKNKSADVAEWFHDHLVKHDTFRGAFAKVIFAVTDWSEGKKFIGPFEKRFGS